MPGAVSSLTLTPISEKNNRITVIEHKKQSAFYYPLTYGDTNSFITVDPSVKKPFSDAKLAKSAAKAAAEESSRSKNDVDSTPDPSNVYSQRLAEINKMPRPAQDAWYKFDVSFYSVEAGEAERARLQEAMTDESDRIKDLQAAAEDQYKSNVESLSLKNNAASVAKSMAEKSKNDAKKASDTAVDSFLVKVKEHSKIKTGKNYPEISQYGFVEIDVVLSGEPDFINSEILLNAVSPASFKDKKYIVKSMSFQLTSEVDGPTWSYDIGIPFEAGQEAINKTDSNEKSRRVVTIPPDAVEIELLGEVSGDGFDFIVFNGSSSKSLPPEAQRASASDVNLFDDNGETMFAEINAESGQVLAYKLNNGVKVYVDAFGYCKVVYTYQATRFKISYDAQEFYYFVMDTHGFSDAINNKDDLQDWIYIISAGKLKSAYRLKRNVEITQINYPQMPAPPMAADIDRSLTEKSRQEIERTIKDDSSGAELKLNVTKSVTLTDGNGEPWDLTFNEQ